MIRTLAHTFLFGLALLAAPFAAADDVDTMHPGLNGFRPGVGNELDARYEPYVQLQQNEAEKSMLSPEWGQYEQRSAGFGLSECQTRTTQSEDSPFSFGYTGCGDNAPSYGETSGRWSFGSD